MKRLRFPGAVLVVTAVLGPCLWCPAPAHGQGASGPTVSDSRVGYIDSAIPATQLRLRYDAAYGDNEPSRAEFFYAQGAPTGGPGLPLPEPKVDYQELYLYDELAWTDCFSTFVEVPIRFVNPDVNDNATGLGDMNFGFKWALYRTEDAVRTFQLRTYVPTGDARLGLGNNHVSLEPAGLFYQRLTDRLALEGELRLWVPVGGTDFAGNVLRYGLGVNYDLGRVGNYRFAPVVEMVGWEVLNGKESMTGADGTTQVLDAAGTSILNIKAGMRVGWCDRGDVYFGYGRPLTGDRWYNDIFRVEVRLFY